MKTRQKRTYDIRRIRLTLSYSVQEAAELFHLHKNAVLNWIKAGLPIIDERRPYLIQGNELASFLKKKQSIRKSKCKPNEFFCFKCRVPRAPNGCVIVKIKNDHKLLLVGACSFCGTRMNKAGSVKNLDQYRIVFSIQTMEERHINECADSIVNSEKRKDHEYEQIQPQEWTH